MQRWERAGEGAWAALEEDAEGRLVDGGPGSRDGGGKRRRVGGGAGGLARGLIRYVALVVDGSAAAGSGDLRPSRLAACCAAGAEFLADLFAGNPFSSACVVDARDGAAKLASPLSGAARAHADALAAVGRAAPAGAFSLQRALEAAAAALEAAPDYGFREVVVLSSSLATRDAGDLNAVAARLAAAKIRCHVVNLAAETYVVRKLAEATGGEFAVALDAGHLASLLGNRVEPPPLAADDARLAGEPPPLVDMGFPRLRVEPAPALASSAGGAPAWRATTHACPRCATRAAELPAACAVCDLPLVSAPHLARSYHHLFPVAAFPGRVAEDGACFACGGGLAPRAFDCPACGAAFCGDCDEAVHAALHVCPGCG